jgi:hypothetical protein
LLLKRSDKVVSIGVPFIYFNRLFCFVLWYRLLSSPKWKILLY